MNEAVDARANELAAPAYYDQETSPLKKRTFLRLVREGRLEGFKQGKRVLVRREHLDAMLAAARVAPIAPANDAAAGDDVGDELDAQLERIGFQRHPAQRTATRTWGGERASARRAERANG